MTEIRDANADATRRTLRWLLGAQLVLAAGLVLVDLAPKIPQLLAPSDQPELNAPTTPGDQTRRYRPRNPANPGPSVDPDMPRRLVLETVEIEGRSAAVLRGAISVGDAARIISELREMRPEIVSLNSPGGSVFDALEIGRALRDVDADTRLTDTAVCLSACPYIFVGGVKRVIDETARFGVHQHSFGASTILPAFLAVEDVQRGQAEVLKHLDTMGIDLKIMGPAMATPSDEIYILTPDEIRDWRVEAQ